MKIGNVQLADETINENSFNKKLNGNQIKLHLSLLTLANTTNISIFNFYSIKKYIKIYY